MNSRRDEEIAASVAAHLAAPARRPASGRPRGQQRSSGQPASAAPASRPPRPSDLLAAGQPSPRLLGGRHDYVGEHQHRPRKWNRADHRHVDRHHVHQWSHLPRRPRLTTRPPLPRLTARQGATPSSSFRQGWPTGLPWLVAPRSISGAAPARRSGAANLRSLAACRTRLRRMTRSPQSSPM